MNAVLIIAGLFLLYEIISKKGTIPLSPSAIPGQASATPIIQGGQVVAAPGFTFQPATAYGPGIGSQLIGSGVAVGATTVSTGSIGAATGLAGTALGTAIPVVGAAFAAIFSALMAASAKRAAEARAENDAVANEVPAWDSGIDQIVAAYNNGSLSASEAVQLLSSPQIRQQNIAQFPNGPLWNAYWAVVCPKVQPGRNACNCGAAPHQPPLTHCSGSYGAGCCVAYDNLDNSQLYAVQAILRAEANPGIPITSTMFPTVYASKYGGIDRPGYSITVQKQVSSMFQL